MIGGQDMMVMVRVIDIIEGWKIVMMMMVSVKLGMVWKNLVMCISVLLIYLLK